MSSSVMPSDALEDERLEHRGVERAVGLGVVRERLVGDRLVLERQAEGAACGGCRCSPSPAGRCRRAGAARRARSARRRSARAASCRASPASPGRLMSLIRRWVGKTVRPGSSRRRGTSARSGARPRRRSPRRRRARSRSGGGRRRSAARCRRGRPGRPRSRSGSAMRQRRLCVPSSSVASPHELARRTGASALEASPRVEREDRGEVGLRGARQAQAVLLGAGVRALVRADAAGAVLLDAHAREDAVARELAAVGAGVVLLERPERRLVVADDGALGAASAASVAAACA